MCAINIPGFTAETSLCRTRTNFRMMDSDGFLFGARAIVPQLPPVGCGPCTDLTWPNGTRTGVCVRDCCDWFGCRTERCQCGSGWAVGGGLGFAP